MNIGTNRYILSQAVHVGIPSMCSKKMKLELREKPKQHILITLRKQLSQNLNISPTVLFHRKLI